MSTQDNIARMRLTELTEALSELALEPWETQSACRVLLRKWEKQDEAQREQERAQQLAEQTHIINEIESR